tara:strand:+ start:1236 stop:1538 length:303 start_codon:yes stop_codon:yes gene_type:complete
MQFKAPVYLFARTYITFILDYEDGGETDRIASSSTMSSQSLFSMFIVAAVILPVLLRRFNTAALDIVALTMFTGAPDECPSNETVPPTAVKDTIVWLKLW